VNISDLNEQLGAVLVGWKSNVAYEIQREFEKIKVEQRQFCEKADDEATREFHRGVIDGMTHLMIIIGKHFQ
jgi:hypothetical protein